MCNTELISRFNLAYENATYKFYNKFNQDERYLFENFENLFLSTDLINDEFMLKHYNNNILFLDFAAKENIKKNISIEFLISIFYIYIKLKDRALNTCQINFVSYTKNENYFMNTYVLDLQTLNFNLHCLNLTNNLQISFPINNIYTFVFPSLHVVDTSNNIFSKNVLQEEEHIPICTTNVNYTNHGSNDNNEPFYDFLSKILYNSLKNMYFDTFSLAEKEYFEDFKNLFYALNSNMNYSNHDTVHNVRQSSKFNIFISNSIVLYFDNRPRNKKYSYSLNFNNYTTAENFSLEFVICFIYFCLKIMIFNDAEQQKKQETEFYFRIQTAKHKRSLQIYKLDIIDFTLTLVNDCEPKYFFMLPCKEITSLVFHDDVDAILHPNNNNSNIYNDINNYNDYEVINDNNVENDNFLLHDETKDYMKLIEKNYINNYKSQNFRQLIAPYVNQLNFEEKLIVKHLFTILHHMIILDNDKTNGIKFCITDAKAEITIHLEQENYRFSNCLMRLCCKSLIWLLFFSFKQELAELSKDKIIIYITTCNDNELVPNFFSLDTQTLTLVEQSHYDVIQKQKKNYQMRKKIVSLVFENSMVEF